MSELITLAISALSHDGRGIGFLAQPGQKRGLAVFVAGALPGQTIACRITRSAPNFREAALVEIIKCDFTPEEPLCPHQAQCGACPLAPLSYREQLRLKEGLARDALAFIGKFPAQAIKHAWTGAFASPATTRFRNKITLAFGKTAAGENALGMRQRGTHAVIPFNACALIDPSAWSIIRETFELAQASGMPFYDGEGFWRFLTLRRARSLESEAENWHAILLTSPADKAQSHALGTLADKLMAAHADLAAIIHEERLERDWFAGRGKRRMRIGPADMAQALGGRLFGLDASSFFQVNNGAAEILAETAKNMAGCGPLLDVCCGVGAPGQLLAASHERCMGLERDAAAVGWARKNAADLKGFSYQCRPYENFLAEMASKGKRGFFQTALLDPPRSGLGMQAVSNLMRMAPERIIHISCDAPAMARDAGMLKAHYELAQMVGIDMFPHAPQLETCALWLRKRKPC